MTQVDSDRLEVGKPEPRRDQYDRAMLLDAQGQRRPFTRASTIAKALDDKDSLINYNSRLTAVGLARRPDLLGIVQSLRDPEGVDKSELRRLVDDAADAGGRGVKANLGTSRHKFTEMLDEGKPIGQILMPDDVRTDLIAYMNELDAKGLRPLPQFCETHCVRDDFDYNGCGVSGSFDKVLGDGADLFIGDIKTGQEVKYAMLAWSIQLAIYANMTHVYDVRTDTRLPMPNVRKDVGFVIWLPAGQGRCEIIEIDLANGWRYAQLAVEVRRARAHGKRDLGRDGALVRYYQPESQQALALAGPPTPPRIDNPYLRAAAALRPTAPLGSTVSFNAPVLKATPSGLVDVIPASREPTNREESAGAIEEIERQNTEERRADWLRERLKTASVEYRNMVATWWQEWNARADFPIEPLSNREHHHNTWELDRIEAWCNEAEANTQETISADPTVVNAKAVLKQFPGTIDEGEAIDETALTSLSANLGLWCQPSRLGLLQAWREEAIRLGHDFGIKECPTTRRLALYELGANLCNLAEGDPANIDVCWAVLITALGWSGVPDTPFGLAFSLLSIEDIGKALELAMQPNHALHFSNTGVPHWAPAPTHN